MERLIPVLKEMGFKVGTIKHHLGRLSLDQPGKDSFRHREAGSEISMIATPTQVGIVLTLDHDPTLEELVFHMRGMDIVLCEGYKHSAFPKIEVFRDRPGKGPMFFQDPTLIALVTEAMGPWEVPSFPPHDPRGLAAFLAERIVASRGRSDGIP
jgi:molybdopterin-guanine dinucleotide biosynthesis protein B